MRERHMHHCMEALTTLLHTCTLGETATKQSVPLHHRANNPVAQREHLEYQARD